jgi:hypothetical protein
LVASGAAISALVAPAPCVSYKSSKLFDHLLGGAGQNHNLFIPLAGRRPPAKSRHS